MRGFVEWAPLLWIHASDGLTMAWQRRLGGSRRAGLALGRLSSKRNRPNSTTLADSAPELANFSRRRFKQATRTQGMRIGHSLSRNRSLNELAISGTKSTKLWQIRPGEVSTTDWGTVRRICGKVSYNLGRG